MRPAAPLSWHEAQGWLILSGRADALSEIRARALSRCQASGDIAYISLAPDQGDALMDDMAELGATSGYIVDLFETDNNEIYERLSNAAMIVIEAEDAGDQLLPLLRSTASYAMKQAWQDGSLILLEGAAAATAGERMLDDRGQLNKGLGWVKGVLMAPDSPGIDDSASSRLRREMPDLTIVSLPPGSALALGPMGSIETWGERQISISLGKGILAQAKSAGEAMLE